MKAQFRSSISPRKRKLALCYDSQIADAGIEQIAEFSRQYEGRERLWANKEWRLVFASLG